MKKKRAFFRHIPICLTLCSVLCLSLNVLPYNNIPGINNASGIFCSDFSPASLVLRKNLQIFPASLVYAEEIDASAYEQWLLEGEAGEDNGNEAEAEAESNEEAVNDGELNNDGSYADEANGEEAEYFYYTNEDTGYSIYIDDGEFLLSGDEIERLADRMWPITAYGHAAFVSGRSDTGSAAEYAFNLYEQLFSMDSGILFLFDMDDREIRIEMDGEIYKTIGRGDANNIADNVYRYATNGDFFTCADTAFMQAMKILEGQWIARPMKWITNILLSLILGLLINYMILWLARNKFKPSASEILDNMDVNINIQNPKANFRNQQKIYHPPSRSSGGGGRSGGGGGGGHSGGGGGHGF